MRALVLLGLCLASCSSGGRMLDGDVPPVVEPVKPPTREVSWSSFALPCENPSSVVLFDLDGDGRSEVAATCGRDVFIGFGGDNPSGNSAQRILTTDTPARLLGSADIDADGAEDLVFSQPDRVSVILKINKGSTLRTYEGAASGFVGHADLNGDGPEEAVIQLAGGRAMVLSNKWQDRAVLTDGPALYTIVGVEGTTNLVGFTASQQVVAVSFTTAGSQTTKILQASDLDPSWVFPMGRHLEDGLLVESGGQVVSLVLDGQEHVFNTCVPSQLPSRLAVARAVVACPDYVAVISQDSFTKLPTMGKVSQVLAGDLNGDNQADLLLITADGRSVANTDLGSLLPS